MDCTTATELLPWLLNGSLGDGERRDLADHLAGCDACRAELGATAAAWELISAHPPTALIAAWAAGDEVPDAELLERHVADCPTCDEEAGLVREAATLEALAPRPAGSAGRDVRWWRRVAVAAVLVAGVSLTALLAPLITVDVGHRSAAMDDERVRIASAEARIEALSAELERLGARAGRLAAPLANLPVIEIVPDSFTLRGGSEPAAVAIGAGAATLILATRAEAGMDGYRLRVLDGDGAELWRADGLVRQPTDDFTVLLPLGMLRPGVLRLVVDGRRGAVWSELESYRLVISSG